MQETLRREHEIEISKWSAAIISLGSMFGHKFQDFRELHDFLLKEITARITHEVYTPEYRLEKFAEKRKKENEQRRWIQRLESMSIE